MAKRMVKCAICGEQFDLNSIQGVVHSARRYSHQTCEPDKELVPMPPKPESKEDDGLKKLKDCIQRIYGDKANYPLIMQQIKKFVEKDKMTYQEIAITLVYFYEVKKNSVTDSKGGIGIVAFAFKDAYEYYSNLWSAQQKNINVDNVKMRVREVTIAPPKSERKIRLFNLDDEEENLNEE